MTLKVPFPNNLTKIDALTLIDHSFLSQDDDCYYLGEYTARKGYAYSDTNNLISNLKKPIEKRALPEWHYKERAILVAASSMRAAVPPDWLSGATFVPIPPSKVKTDPNYDDRMTRILQAINLESPVDSRELIIRVQNSDPAHESSRPREPNQIRSSYTIDDELCHPSPTKIIICDDVLTTGASFKAAKAILSEAFPDVDIRGVFIARRAPVDEDDTEICF